MVSNSANTGAAGQLIIEAWETTLDAGSNTSYVNFAAYLNERTSYGFSFSGGVGASVTTQYGTVWSGSFAFDWRPGGLQSALIASGGYWADHDPDGGGYIDYTANMSSTGTTGAGGPASVTVRLNLTDLSVAPDTPNSVVATRISDTQVNLTWNDDSADNAQPTSNQILRSINGSSYVQILDIAATESASIVAAANQKLRYKVKARNDAGTSSESSASAAIYTTPGAPTGGAATKVGANIVVTFTPNVGYTEHTHEVWHGTISGGVTTWDGSALATLASGVATYTHTAPSSAQVHVYRVRAKAGSLASAYNTTNSVALLAAPNKPTIPALPAYADKASTFRFPWVHNPVDSSDQTKYQWRWSTNGGSSWTTGSKTSSTALYHDFAGSTWTANQAVTFQVRTKGAYDSGSDGDASYSPWSDSVLVTFKTIPVATITAPANGGSITESELRATIGFSQAESATFVKAQLELLQGATLLETLESAIQVGIIFATPMANGVSYTVRARVQDSNGLWSSWVTSAFSVTYLPPVPAVATVVFLPDSGFGQIGLTIAAPGGGQSAAVTLSITRTIGDNTEAIVTGYPVSSPITFLDTTPTTHGTNTYTITTKSAAGAESVTTIDLVTEECRRAYLSKGASYETVVAFGGNLTIDESLGVASTTVQAAGRVKPIGLYGVETTVQLNVKSFIFENFGSPISELQEILLMPGKACYRDPSGRRTFGSVQGSISHKKTTRGDLSFTLTETS